MAGGLTHTRKCKLTIQASKITSALTDFPVLITEDTLPSEIFDADGSNPAQNGGGDIRFLASDDSTQLPCEVVSFVTNNNPALGTCEIWVKVSSISASVDTDIYIYYNTSGTDSQPAVTNTYGRNAVWTDYLAVLHLVESGNGTAAEYIDSTGNGYDAQGGGGTSADVPAQTTTDHPWGGTWQSFDGSTDYILVPTGSGMDNSYISVQAMTVIDTAPDPDQGLVSNRWSTQNNNFFQITPTDDADDTDDGTNYIINDGTGPNFVRGTTTPATGTDYWIALTTESGALRGYLNGSQEAVDTSIPGDGQFATSLDTRIGTYFDGSSNRSLDAKIGGVRFRTDTLSADWISAEYNNQNDPATFLIEGTPESAGAPPAGYTMPLHHHYQVNIGSQ